MFIRPWDANPEVGDVAFSQRELERRIPDDFYQHEFPEVARHLRGDLVALLEAKGCTQGEDGRTRMFLGKGIEVDEATGLVSTPADAQLRNVSIQMGSIGDEVIPHIVVLRNDVEVLTETGLAVFSQTYHLGPDNEPIYACGATILSRQGEPILDNPLERMPYTDHPDLPTQRIEREVFVSFELSDKVLTKSFACEQFLEGSETDITFYEHYLDGNVFDAYVEGTLFLHDVMREFRDEERRFSNGTWL